MIVAKQIPLPIQEAKDFRTWIDKGASQTLFKLLEARIKFHQSDASNDGLKITEFNGYNAGTVSHFILAKRYATALDVLQEIFKEEEHYTVTLT